MAMVAKGSSGIPEDIPEDSLIYVESFLLLFHSIPLPMHTVLPISLYIESDRLQLISLALHVG